MALWYETGNGFVKTSFARKGNNCAAFVCCGGPSLNKIDPSIIKGHNRIVFGLNNTYPFIIPDIWIGMDDPYCYHRDIFDRPFPKIMRGGYAKRERESGRVDGLFNTFYADCKKPENFEETFTRRAHDVKFVWKKSTLITALHIIVWMGCRKIYLFGNDLNNSNGDYFDSVTLSDKFRKRNEKFYKRISNYLWNFKEIGKKYGIELYSCSEGSAANDFLDYYDYKDVIKDLEKDLPKDYKLYHAVDAEAMWEKKCKKK